MTATNVLIAPCYGNRVSRRRFDRTMVEEVEIGPDGRGAHLTPTERHHLSALHPSMTAPFWGARELHHKTMAKLSPGDVVLFTGDRKVKAIGEFGHLFQNTAFADAMWRHSPDEEGFAFIYSLVNVRHLNADRGMLLSLPGFNPNDPLTGQRLVRPHLVDGVLDAFGMRGVEREFAAGLAASAAVGRVIPGERHNTDYSVRTTRGGVTIVYRSESRLVATYRDYCEAMNRFRTQDGRYADIFHDHGDEVEVVEAKSAASREKVREALAQLLDYAPAAPTPVTRLAALFPEAPDERNVRFLARYGIDCVYADGDEFVRIDADAERRAHMLPVWREV